MIAKLRGILAEDFPSVRSRSIAFSLARPVGWPVQIRVVGPNAARFERLRTR